MEKNRIMVMGASGWIGHYVLQFLHQNYPVAPLLATYRTRHPLLHEGARGVSVLGLNSYINAMRGFRPDVLLNLNRGETEDDYQTHLGIVEETKKMGCHYAFASTFNACDANLAGPHLEDEVAHAQSDYGKFKARCEQALVENSPSFTIFRFSMTHGWAPNRVARTEEFLQKLKAGERQTIRSGVMQNRTAVCDLAGMMVQVMQKRGQGVYNLGTVDSSDEVDFLRSLAKAFGYPPDVIVAAKAAKTDAVMVPEKLFELCGSKWRKTENDTIKYVSNQVELQKYKSRGNSFEKLR